MRIFLKLHATVLVLMLSGCAGHAHYTGMQTREIKALSAEDIEGLKAGQGMSLALAAELNGYPGPLHVLQLESKLLLSPEQKRQTQQLMARMRTAAIEAGESLIEAEKHLDGLFAGKTVTPESLASALGKVAQARERVRGVHLQAHLDQVRILTGDQVAQYNRLRGYGG
jgi:hypothetical protein